jgi:hypothetical protein
MTFSLFFFDEHTGLTIELSMCTSRRPDDWTWMKTVVRGFIPVRLRSSRKVNG